LQLELEEASDEDPDHSRPTLRTSKGRLKVRKFDLRGATCELIGASFVPVELEQAARRFSIAIKEEQRERDAIDTFAHKAGIAGLTGDAKGKGQAVRRMRENLRVVVEAQRELEIATRELHAVAASLEGVRCEKEVERGA
jgi:hypothetical protein